MRFVLNQTLKCWFQPDGLGCSGKWNLGKFATDTVSLRQLYHPFTFRRPFKKKLLDFQKEQHLNFATRHSYVVSKWRIALERLFTHGRSFQTLGQNKLNLPVFFFSFQLDLKYHDYTLVCTYICMIFLFIMDYLFTHINNSNALSTCKWC